MALPGVQIRTSLTPKEWERFQKLAAKQDLPAARLAAHVLRAYMKGENHG